MTVTLPPDLEPFVQRRVDSGRYSDANEVIRAALALLDERDRLEQSRSASASSEGRYESGGDAEYLPDSVEKAKH
jgi:putative addiction module CopG family antidote